MKELEINHVYKDYKLGNKSKFNALSDINVSFEKGELVSIIGESGSGKSTLMNLIGGLDSDYTGEIKIGVRSSAQSIVSAKAGASSSPNSCAATVALFLSISSRLAVVA